MAFFFLGLNGCKKKETHYTYEIMQLKHSFLAAYKNSTEGHYQSTLNLYNKTNLFCSSVNLSTFNNCRGTWFEARRNFHFLQPFARMNGNIENPIVFEWNLVELNSINIEYLDSTNASPTTGIIVNPALFPNINSLNLQIWDDPLTSNRTNGFQVMEFILFGEDDNPVGGGSRIFQDFSSANQINTRRRNFLSSVNFNLKSDLSKDFYKQSFVNDIIDSSPEDFMQFYLRGLVKFIELDIVEKAIDLPLYSLDQSKELSRFSENTMSELVDMLDALEINIDGRDYFDSHNDFFLIDLIRKIDSKAGDQILSSIKKSREALNEIDSTFDNAIMNPSDRAHLEVYREEMLNISTQLKSIAALIGIQL